MCVYEKEHILVKVTQQKNEELAIPFNGKTQCSFQIQVYKNIFLEVSIFGELNFQISAKVL